jgi:hypothetical protein
MVDKIPLKDAKIVKRQIYDYFYHVEQDLTALFRFRCVYVVKSSKKINIYGLKVANFVKMVIRT